jgi:hypothetical protein
MLKRFFSAIPLAVALLAMSTSVSSETLEECGTVVTPAQIRLEQERIRTGWIYSMPEKIADVYSIPVTIHIVRSSGGTGGFDPANLELAMNDANIYYQDAGLEFYVKGDIDFIDDDYFFYDLTTYDKYDSLRLTNVVPNTINTYLVSIESEFPYCGLGTFTASPIQGIIVKETCTGTPDNPSTLAHEYGHYFDLYHTHESYFGEECPEGTGCDTLGDLMCDTRADPGLYTDGFYHVSEFPECAYDNYITVPDHPHCDQVTPYDPPVENLMSYSLKRCRTSMSVEQGDRAVLVLLTAENRRNLLSLSIPSLNIYGIIGLIIIVGVTSVWLIRRRQFRAKMPL